jgi:hypothetical protein
MKCEACMQLIDDFVDGELPEVERRKVGQHINECVECEQEADFLRNLSRDAASLPKLIQPEKDLWPGIAIKIMAAPISGNDGCEKVDVNSEREDFRRKGMGWRWWIAAAALLGTFVLAGTYFGIKNQMARHSNQGVLSGTAENKSAGHEHSPPTGLLDKQVRIPAESKTGMKAGPDTRSSGLQAQAILSYPMDMPTLLFVSNYGIYGLNPQIERSVGFLFLSITRFERNETQSWIPPLPPGGTLLSLYPGSGNRLWIAYEVKQPQSQSYIAELDFQAESEISAVWKSPDLYIQRFVPGPRGLIYVAGFTNDIRKKIPKLTKGQSITVDPVHIIDTTTGEERHLFPMTLRPKFDSPNWAGQTVADLTCLTPIIAVKSNGNFFVTIDRNLASALMREMMIKNEAIEYSPDGTVVSSWKLGTLEPNAYLNRIFVDMDDSILAEIVKYAETGTADSTNGTIIDRYLLRVSLAGKVTRCELSLLPNEDIQGWMGQTRDLVTLVRGSQPAIRVYRLSF